MIDVPLTSRQAEELTEYVGTHMMHCYNLLNEEDEDDILPEFEPFGAYCGCETCNAREQFMSTFQWLRNNNIVDIYVQD